MLSLTARIDCVIRRFRANGCVQTSHLWERSRIMAKTFVSPTAKHGKFAFLFVLVTVFIDMLAFGLIMPVLPELIVELTGSSINEAVRWAGPLAAVYALMNFLFTPLLGNLSDRFGRRPVLLASLGTLGLDFLIMALSQNIWVLFIGRTLSGISGATFSITSAYIADTVEKERRGQAFGMIGAAFGLGFIIGPGVGGLLAGIDDRAPFYFAACLSLINFLYGLFILPESLAPENRRKLDLARANPLGAFRHFSRVPQVGWLLLALGLYQFAHHAYPATWSYHGQIRYDWSVQEVGISLSLVGLTTAIVQGGLTGVLIKRLGEVRTAWLGLTANVFTLVGFALADLPWMAYAIIMVSAISGVFTPAVNALTSSVTPADAQGELHGATASIQSLTAIFSPLLMTEVLFRFSADDAPIYFPGAAFLLAGILCALALPLLSIGLARNKSEAVKPEAKS